MSISNMWQFKVLPREITDVIEQLWIETKMHNGSTVMFGNIYRPLNQILIIFVLVLRILWDRCTYNMIVLSV